MRKPGIAEMSAFAAVAERASFVKAARHPRRLTLDAQRNHPRARREARRAPAQPDNAQRRADRDWRTPAGGAAPGLESLEQALESINVFRDKPAGHLRLTVPRPTAETVIEPIVAKFLTAHPAITLEIATDSALTDIVRDRFDAGIRPGHRVEQDMIVVGIGEDARPKLVASPAYLARHPAPKEPADLRSHNCIRQRFASGVVHRWPFEKRGKAIEVTVTGSLISSDGDLAIRAALDGVGIARVPATYVETHIAGKRLVALLDDWAPPSVGFFLYYPSRRQMPVALQALIDALKAHARTVRRTVTPLPRGKGRMALARSR